ncbi:hypothetical protein T492DRAFT_868749 [Pavlovales sp. CCMP2436]|nr:hypothetical protein T492DRAFT_868749 [Pavlovales sp. CCMP2436]
MACGAPALLAALLVPAAKLGKPIAASAELRGALNRWSGPARWRLIDDSVDASEFVPVRSGAQAYQKHLIEANPGGFDVFVFELNAFGVGCAIRAQGWELGDLPITEHTLSMWTSIATSLRLARTHAAHRGTAYERIVLARPDVLLWTPIKFHLYYADRTALYQA